MKVPPITEEFVRPFAGFLCAIHDSLDAADRHFPSRWQRGPKGKPWRFLFNRVAPHMPEDGVILEFGVYKGSTTRHLAKLHPKRRIYGFDSFKGFPNDGRRDWRMKFELEKAPKVPSNVTLVEGYFEDTIPEFAKSLSEPIAMVHIDCDLFSSTQTVLDHLAPHLGPGHILVFDELIHYARFAMNEVMALYLFLQNQNLDFEWVEPIGGAFPYSQSEGVLLKGGMKGHRAQGYFQNQAIRLTADKRHFNSHAPDPVVEFVLAQMTQHYG